MSGNDARHMTKPAAPLSTSPNYCALRGGGTFVAIEATQGERPIILYAGPDMPGASPAELATLATQQHAPGTAAVPLRGSMLNEMGTGIPGPNGLLAHRNGCDWAIDLRLVRLKQSGDHALTLHLEDTKNKIAATHELAIDQATGVLSASTRIENQSDAVLELEWCAAPCLPFDPRLQRIFSFTGQWAGEFAIEEIAPFQGSIVRENSSGRTSHDSYPGLFAGTQATTELSGPAAAFHLAWSGNSRLRVDRHKDGRSVLQMGDLLFPGEIRLAQGEGYQSPDLVAVWSDTGFNDVSNRLHDFVPDRVLDQRSRSKPRPVHYNTWEAVYFGHDETALLDLAERAAVVGAERFVLDDGWFGGRRGDAAGLGDWWVSSDVYPAGLHVLVSRVRQLGMEFGLWFEPEMVSPDSDLFRAHPEWVLRAPHAGDVPFRGQHTLDLTREDVCDYLFDKISSLVSEYDIAYIKWDMNRDTPFPSNADGRAVMHQQTRAVYQLIQRLRDTHEQLEIESCSSGGARADYGVLRHTDRVWTSDNNDARARHQIMRGASHFLPLRVLGNHVGPKTCHITGRKFTMHFRVASAIFGHMGMELDLRRESEVDLATLKAGIALHKRHRELIHNGRFVRLPSSETKNSIGCVARDQSEALFLHAKLDTELHTLPARLHFAGLDPARDYRVRLVWPLVNPSLSTPSIIETAKLLADGSAFSGAALMGYGIQPPLTFPDTGLIYHLEATD